MDESFYDNDLQLAAELGKILLERNKEVEAQILQLQNIASQKDEQIARYEASSHEQSMQAEVERVVLEQSVDRHRFETRLLTKQVEVLRHANDSRMRIFEDIDKNAQELEKTNEALRKDVKEGKERIKDLNETIESFETRCEELQAKLEQQKRELKSSRKDKEYNRTWSVPSLVDGGVEYKGLTRGSYDYLGFPSMNQCWNQKKEESNSREIKDLRETVRTLKMQYFAEQKRRMDIEADLNNSLGENKNLLVKIKDFEEVISKKEELKIEKSAAMAEASQHPVKCAKCSSRAASVAGSDIGDSDFIEHDLDDLPRKQVVRLKCGGSAFGSRESLNQIGLEAVTPTLESCSDVLALAVVQRNVDTPEEDVDEEEDDNTMKAPDPDSTLLGELEEQYRKLVKKYERLVETKSQREHKSKESSAQSSQSSINTLNGTEDVVRRRPKTLTISKEVQTAWRKSSCLDFTSPADPTEGHFQKGPPEYKKLFKEIFDTLQKAAGDDVDQLNTSTSSTS